MLWIYFDPNQQQKEHPPQKKTEQKGKQENKYLWGVSLGGLNVSVVLCWNSVRIMIRMNAMNVLDFFNTLMQISIETYSLCLFISVVVGVCHKFDSIYRKYVQHLYLQINLLKN
jgi:hypothetical protein